MSVETMNDYTVLHTLAKKVGTHDVTRMRNILLSTDCCLVRVGHCDIY